MGSYERLPAFGCHLFALKNYDVMRDLRDALGWIEDYFNTVCIYDFDGTRSQLLITYLTKFFTLKSQ